MSGVEEQGGPSVRDLEVAARPRDEAPFPVVALVSCAAASETLARVLAPLPADFPAALIAMHASPPGKDREQARALADRIRLRVRLARDGDALVPGTVLLIPAERQPLVDPDGCLRLVDLRSVPGRQSPVAVSPLPDLLLHTLAGAVGPRAIAVLLSGRGQPGTLGAQAVCAHGGRMLVRGRPVAEVGRAAQMSRPGDQPSPPLTLDTMASTLLRVVSRAPLGRAR